ncbi:MAG: ABC transporter ATP-binding protein, partial [Defluviitaleaceae bacterium]|nr:ABC transporter ATP-binding protein [Defluviitaleaceae bacterium]
MSKLTKYIKPYRWFFVLTLLLLLAESMASLLLPSLMANIVDNGIMRGVAEDTPQTAYILQMGFFMLMVALLSGLAAVGAGYLAPRISAG